MNFVGVRIMKKQISLLVTLGLMALILAACTATGPQEPGSPGSSAPGAVETANKDLVFGISVGVPNGWTIRGSANKIDDPVKDAEITKDMDKRLAAGDHLPVIDISRPANNADQMDFRVTVMLVNASKEFLPEGAASVATQAELDMIAKKIMEEDEKAAVKAKTQSKMLEWHVTRSMVNGRLAITQYGLGRKSEGARLFAYNQHIYLPNGKGIFIRGIADADIPNVHGIMTSISNTVRYNR